MIEADYFTVPRHSFWQWQDNGNVVTWSDGATIVFRAELLPIYQRLHGQSLPPFGAVILLLAACRESWDQPSHRIELLAQLLRFGKRPDRLELLQRVGKGLDRVRALDAPLRTATEAKAELAAMVFEQQAEPALPTTFDRLIAELKQGLSESVLQPRRTREVVDRLLRDLAWLARGLSRVDPAALTLRLRAGLEQLVEPAEIEVPAPAASRKLLSELKEHPELGGVARLAQLLLAAVHLPTPLSFPEELPVGGVSDISNRGTLDRLLLSELASDDLTLAVRLAMNEALYLRREIPPQPPPRRRLVLLDSGLRMWGVPRLFATSVGLALTAGANDATNVDVYRAAGVDLAEVDLSSADGLIEHLAALDHHVHPGEALAALAAKIDNANEACDVVVVTGDDVYADRAFQRQLAELQLPELHVATLGRDGSFRLHLQTPRGHKLLRQAQFALNDVLRPSTRPGLALITAPFPLPAIFAVERFPLRLSWAVDAYRSWHVEDFGVLTYTRDGRLLHWTDRDHGALQLVEGLPAGNLHWAASRTVNDAIHAVIGRLSRQGMHGMTLALGGGCKCVRLDVDLDQPKYAFVHQSVAFVGNDTELNACSLNTGQLLSKRSLEAAQHASGRFFHCRKSVPGLSTWSAAAFNGREIVFAEFYTEPSNRDRLLTVVEAAYCEGPIGLLCSGALINFSNRQQHGVRRVESTEELQLCGVSRSGERLLVGIAGSPSKFVIDVRTMSCVASVNGGENLEWGLLGTAKPRTMRHRFKAVGVDVLGRLTLIGRRETRWPLEYAPAHDIWKLPAQPSAVELRVVNGFNLIDESPVNRYSLSVAKFADGTIAVLDDRGLLHLKSSDQSLPEVSLVLVEGLTAGWASDGYCWGSHYFLTDPSPQQVNKSRDLLLRIAQRMA